MKCSASTLPGYPAEKDDYLDVFIQDMVYSDQPITRNISEDLADIYQAIKDFHLRIPAGFERDDERLAWPSARNSLPPPLGTNPGQHTCAPCTR